MGLLWYVQKRLEDERKSVASLLEKKVLDGVFVSLKSRATQGAEEAYSIIIQGRHERHDLYWLGISHFPLYNEYKGLIYSDKLLRRRFEKAGQHDYGFWQRIFNKGCEGSSSVEKGADDIVRAAYPSAQEYLDAIDGRETQLAGAAGQLSMKVGPGKGGVFHAYKESREAAIREDTIRLYQR